MKTLKKKLVALLIPLIVILVFATLYSSTQLKVYWVKSVGYPQFLISIPNEKLSSEINKVSEGERLSSNEVEYLWKLLWIKKEFYPKQYLTNKEREIIVERIKNVKPNNLYENYLQTNILRYELGINDDSELNESSVCVHLFLNETNWDDLFDVAVYFDVLHFCDITVTELDLRKLNQTMSNAKVSVSYQHCMEHCANDIQVKVNDCDNTQGHESYHCLYFLD